MELLNWSVLIGIVIVVCATVGLVSGRLDAKDFVTCVACVLSFLSGGAVAIGYRMAGRREAGTSSRGTAEIFKIQARL